VERIEAMDGVTIVRQGAMFRFEGPAADKLSVEMRGFLMQVADAGLRTADYMQGFTAGGGPDHPTSFPSAPAADTGAADGDVPTPTSDEASAAEEFLRLLRERVQPRYDIDLGDNAAYAGSDRSDSVQGGADSVIDGGDGDDRIAGYERLTAQGGAGDDDLRGYGNADLDGGAGNDRLEAYGGSRLVGGDGHDYISAYGNATVGGGAGNDFVSVSGDSTVDAGAGDDFIVAGDRVRAQGGAGADIFRLGAYADAAGGAGDDMFRVGANATIHFDRGDGVDTVESQGGWVGMALAQQAGRSIDTLASAQIAFGPGIGAGDVEVTRHGPDLRIGLAGTDDAVIVRDVERRGVPSLSFDDGSGLSGAEVLARATGSDVPPGGLIA
jgi:hypothetical protein